MAKSKNAVVTMSDPTKRAEIEARRGIVRDENGHIIRSKQWMKARKLHLNAKKADLQQRTKNIEAELKALGKKGELMA